MIAQLRWVACTAQPRTLCSHRPAVHCGQRHAGDGYERLGFALLDAASATFHLGCVAEDANLSGLRTLLSITSPSEVLLATAAVPARVVRTLKQFANGAPVTSIPAEEVPGTAAAAAVLAAKPPFRAVAAVIAALPEAERPAEGQAALVALLEHVARMKLLPLLSGSVQVRRQASCPFPCPCQL